MCHDYFSIKTNIQLNFELAKISYNKYTLIIVALISNHQSRLYVEEKLGTRYTEKRNIPFEESYEETGPETPVFFVLSPGVDPLKDVESLGKKLGFTVDNNNFHNVSLGQGQEVVAENALDVASQDGHWVILQVSSIYK